MRKSMRKALAIVSAGLMLASATVCTSCDRVGEILGSLLGSKQHEHVWTDWERTATGHSRICMTCFEVNSGTHSFAHKCSDCGAYFRVLAIGFTSGGDMAHADFAVEANKWFAEKGEELFFYYESYTDYSKLNDEDLANYDLVMFLNGIPGSTSEQDAFRRYMENGGAFMAYHSAAFAMWSDHTPPSDWHDWYHNTLLRSGEYGNRPYEDGSGGIYWNTWDPTADYLLAETETHYTTKNLDLDENGEFLSAPCEWYAWSNDLLTDDEVTVLLTLNPTPERPAGNDPREGMEYQIWTSGKHPIAWANNEYKMIYMNWGHNLQSYNHFEKESKTFSSPVQCQFVINAMYGLVTQD